jgi:hypothetical protein
MWCHIISRTPGFWASLRLAAPIRHEDGKKFPYRCDFQNVNDGPVDVTVDEAHDGFDPDSSLKVGSTIREQLSRIRVFIIYSIEYRHWRTADYLDLIFPPNQQTVLPAMKILNLSGYHPHADRVNIGKIHAPKLYFLSLPYTRSLFHVFAQFTPDSLRSLNILFLSSLLDTATINALVVCFGMTVFRWTIEYSEDQGQATDIPAILSFPSLKQFTIIVDTTQLTDKRGENFIPLINAPVVESICQEFKRSFKRSTLDWGMPGPNPRKIADTILTFDTHFLSELYLQDVDFSNEQVSILLLGHSLPALGYLALKYCILTPSFLLSLMPCGSLYDSALDYRPLLHLTSCNRCGVVAHPIVLSHDLPQPKLSLFASGYIYSRTRLYEGSSPPNLEITSDEAKECLDSGMVDDLDKLTELYGSCCEWP